MFPLYYDVSLGEQRAHTITNLVNASGVLRQRDPVILLTKGCAPQIIVPWCNVGSMVLMAFCLTFVVYCYSIHWVIAGQIKMACAENPSASWTLQAKDLGCAGSSEDLSRLRKEKG